MQLLVLDVHAVVSVCSGFQIVSTIQLLYPSFKIKFNRLTDHRFSHVDVLIFSDLKNIFFSPTYVLKGRSLEKTQITIEMNF